jgi:chromosomal replication initiator protein
MPRAVAIIQAHVAREFGVTVAQIIGPRRTKAIVLARFAAVYLASEITGRSLPDLGRRFGDRDHTTIYSALCKMPAMIEADPDFASRVKTLMLSITGTT